MPPDGGTRLAGCQAPPDDTREYPLTIGRYLPIVGGMRRKEGVLVPLEVSILEAAVELRSRGVAEAHGFMLAKAMRDRQQARRLTAYGTLYKALYRLERAGHLTSRWEDPRIGASEGRPRRRLYRVTLVGEGALERALEGRRTPTAPRAAAVQLS